MALDNIPIEGDDFKWKSRVEAHIKDLEKTIGRLEGRISYLEGRARHK